MSTHEIKVDKKVLQKLIHRVAVLKFLANLDFVLRRHNINHSELSQEAGRNSGAFNKTFNRVEDLTFSSFLRYWRATQRLFVNVANTEPPSFEDLLDPEIQRLIDVASELYTFEVEDVVTRERSLFSGMVALVERLKRQRVFSNNDPELETFELVKQILSI